MNDNDRAAPAHERHAYRDVNRRGWAELVRHDCEWSRPHDVPDFARARELLDPRDWLPWSGIRSVLCLAGGGGQQGPLFASLGIAVTVLDLSPEQLERDRESARRYGYDIELVEGDMLDLSPLYGRGFDLVYQPVSALYVPDVRRMYAEVSRVLDRHGHYFVEHWNPIYVQIPETGEWDGEAYRIVHAQQRETPIPQTVWEIGESEVPITTWQYIHPLGDLIGGLCDEGYAIVRFAENGNGDLSAEPGSPAHLAAFLPPSFAMLAHRA